MSQVYQARFPNMTCNQCAGPIEVGQGIQRDGRKVRQDGTEGGTAWKHANPSECRAARSNPRRRRKTARRNTSKDMHGQDLRKKNFRGANLWGAQLWRSNLSGVNLSNATLAQAAIWEADLSGANLSGAQLGEANLAGSNLTGANLRGAKMVDTNIDGADFTEADLRGTDLADVMFSENARFMNALYDDKTEWPWNIEDPEMQVGARHERTMVLNPRRRRNAATAKRRSTRTRRNPSTSAKLEALGKKYGTRSKAGKLAMAIAKDLKRQGH